MLKLKEDYKKFSGIDWKPSVDNQALACNEKQQADNKAVAAAVDKASSSGGAITDAGELRVKIEVQGLKVRDLKGHDSSKVRFYLVITLSTEHFVAAKRSFLRRFA